MAIKKSELYSTLWASCDKLRGGMDASQYKDYVLVLLFIKYVSDKYSSPSDNPIIIPEGGSFSDMVALKGKKDIGEGINRIIYKLAEANGLTGIITQADFNDEEKLGKGKEMQDKLSDLVTIFENPDLDFSRNRADGDDILGDAYEYLMRHFAAESGKSKGQFYTPAEVSRIMASLLGINSHNSGSETSAYDPTCGSGSLLLKIAGEAGRDILLFGQEKEVTTAGLAKMNMILHNSPGAIITKGQSTLSSPLFVDGNALMQFDYAVSNPPFSSKNWTDGFNPHEDVFGRFEEFGVPPVKNGDYAFLLHIIHSLKPKGKGAVILPHGILFRGNAEGDIRTKLVNKGYIKGIIGLPPNLFYGTGIPACLVVIDKENAAERKSIFMIDAAKGYTKDGNKNRLREQDIRKIIDVFTRQLPVDKYSCVVSHEQIRASDYNLNISRYIDNQPPQDLHDIQAHLLGGIPDSDITDLKHYWDIYPSLREELFQPVRQGYSKLRVGPDQIRPLIFNQAEFKAYAEQINQLFLSWQDQNSAILKNIGQDDKPREIILLLGETLLETFRNRPLLDNYDIYQCLMTYWNDVMQDDVYTIVSSGWKSGNDVENNRKKSSEGRLIPRQLIISEFFLPLRRELEILESKKDAVSIAVQALEEEHSGEDSMLAEVLNDKGKVNKTLLAKRIKALAGESAFPELKMAAEPHEEYGELALLEKLSNLFGEETALSGKIKELSSGLEKEVLKKYNALTIEEIKTLVVELKWIKKLQGDLDNEMSRISHRLADRIRELAERYESTLPQLLEETEKLEARVKIHLNKMGFEWN